MAQQLINIGTTADDHTGDPLRAAGVKINDNFTELYSVGAGYTRASLLTATIPAAVKTLRTSGYDAFGDGGHGLYKRLQSAPATPTNKAYFRSVDRFRADGTTDATHGGYWQLVPQGGEVWIEQFGGKADWNGTTGTDNYQPLIDAVTLTVWQYNALIRFSHRIKIGVGRWYIGQTVNLHEIVHIQGVGSATAGQGASLNTGVYFPANTTGFVIHGNNSGPGENGYTGTPTYGDAVGCKLEGFAIHGSGSDLTHVGVLMRGTAELENLGFFTIPGNAIWIRATVGASDETWGNANQWKITKCMVHSCTKDALRIEGSDVNGGQCAGFVTMAGQSVGGCGIYDNSGVGANVFSGLQISGYGNKGVHYLGKLYQVIHPDLAVVAATTPGTNNQVWYYLGPGSASSVFPEYNASDATQRFPKIPIFNTGAFSLFLAPYIEAGSGVRSHVPNASIVIGGNGAYTSYSNVMLGSGVGNSGVSHSQMLRVYREFLSANPEYAVNGPSTYASIGEIDSNGIKAWSHGRTMSTDSPFGWSYGYEGNDLEYRSPISGRPRIFKVTTTATAETFGRSTVQPGYMAFYDFGLIHPADATVRRAYGIRDAVPGGGAQGEFFFNHLPTAGGTFGWLCVGSGTPGTWIPLAAVFKQPNAYTASNVSADRTYDANATTLDELADVVGTIIADLKLAGILT